MSKIYKSQYIFRYNILTTFWVSVSGRRKSRRSRSIPTEHFFLYCAQLEPEAKQRVDDRDSRFSGDWTVVELAAGQLIRRTGGRRDTSVDRRVRRCGPRLLLHAASWLITHARKGARLTNVHRQAEKRNRFSFVCISSSIWQKLMDFFSHALGLRKVDL